MGIQILTFGGLRALDGTGELDRLLAQRSRAALLVYLTIERRVSRDLLTALFWPESDAESARHALRQSLYHLKKATGSRAWIDARGFELVIGAEIVADANLFTEAVARGDAERAVRLYQGPFLDGVHLLNAQSWEQWVDRRRTKYARAFRKTSREIVDVRHSAGDHAGAIDVAERWTTIDPTDDEAQHRLIALLVEAGQRSEAIHQYESYARLLELEGLEPLDETRRLVERFHFHRRSFLTSRAGRAS